MLFFQPSCSSSAPLFSYPSWRKGKILFRVACLVLVVLFLFACSSKKAPSLRDDDFSYFPTQMDETPERFLNRSNKRDQQLSSWKDLKPNVRACLDYIGNKPANSVAFSHAGERVTWGELRESLRALLSLLPKLDANPGLLNEKFRWVSLGGIHFTSYYEMCIAVRKKKAPGFTCPIYARPHNLSSYKQSHGGKYLTRAEINGGALAGSGLEIAWGDPLDVYLLHIEGSGRLVFEDGRELRVNTDGTNGYAYRGTGNQGLDVRNELQWREFRLNGFGKVRKYSPAQLRKMDEDPSYVFFEAGGENATGAAGILKGWVSLAVDPSYIPLGSIVAYAVNSNDFRYNTGKKMAIRGIGLAQDVGGAIKGKHIDIYSGGDACAMYYGSLLSGQGPAWVLLRR